MRIYIIENMHYCVPDSSGSWLRQNLHPGPSQPANTHYFREYALWLFFYKVSEPWLSLLKSLTENWNWEKFWPANNHVDWCFYDIIASSYWIYFLPLTFLHEKSLWLIDSLCMTNLPHQEQDVVIIPICVNHRLLIYHNVNICHN